MRLFWLFLTLATTLTTALRSGTAKTPANAILLSKVKTLTVRAGKQTTARRVSSIPQLKCIGGNARPLYEVDVMQCKNTGSDYGDEDVQWSCKASLPPEFKLGSTDVICEGYDSPDDPYVLKGSCGVEYRLVLTEAGEAKYGAGHDDEEGGLGQSTKNLIFWGFCIFIAYIFLKGGWDAYQRSRGRQPRGTGWGGGGGGGGGGDDDNDSDPPPPYSRRPPSKSSYNTYMPRQTRGQQGWQPGFWSGAAAGAGAGYAASLLGGNRNQNRGYDSTAPRWGSPGQGPSSSPSPSSSRYESMGFGGTSRR